MKAFVITLEDLPESVECARRCIQSAWDVDALKVEMSPAWTPKEKPVESLEESGWCLSGFRHNPYSRLEPCVATFLSHWSLWCACSLCDEPFLILEHDAVFQRVLPDLSDEAWCVNLGKPSFGKWKQPSVGFGPLTSKRYLPGAHAYYVAPAAARAFLRKAAKECEPTDVYLNRDRFPFIREYYPWPIVCDDSFSTIQKEEGCRAKHNKVKPI